MSSEDPVCAIQPLGDIVGLSNGLVEAIAFVRIRLASVHPESDPTLILRIIEQGASNSVRHGLPDRIDVEISTQPTSGTRVKIADNGHGQTRGKHGLGFKLIPSCTKGWPFRRGTKGGAELIAVP